MLDVHGVTQSLDIPEQNFGHTYHALMIPPYPMGSVLHLGYGNGTVAALIDRVWPFECEHVGVDVREPDAGCAPPVFVLREAWQFVEWSEKVYDYVIVDIYQGKRIPDFVFSEKFIENVSRLCGKMLALNCTFYNWKDFEKYGKHFVPDACKTVNQDKVMMMVPKGLFEPEF